MAVSESATFSCAAISEWLLILFEIRPPPPEPIIWSRPSYSTNVHSISTNLKRVAWITFSLTHFFHKWLKLNKSLKKFLLLFYKIAFFIAFFLWSWMLSKQISSSGYHKLLPRAILKTSFSRCAGVEVEYICHVQKWQSMKGNYKNKEPLFSW